MVKLNDEIPQPRGVWEHVVTETKLMVLSVREGVAYCALMNGPKVTRARVAVPAIKLKNWGNRGFAHMYVRKGGMPKLGDTAAYPAFNARRANLGAK